MYSAGRNHPGSSATLQPLRERAGREELVVLSHLRWTFVWQRPQQLISRLARRRKTWFVEEPQAVDGLQAPRLRVEQHGEVARVWLEVPGAEPHVCFSDPRASEYGPMLRDLLAVQPRRTAWLYTPMALPLAQALAPDCLVYDVMDDLAAFKGAPAQLDLRQRQALRVADVVFTGGRSLHRSVLQRGGEDAHCFPSGVDPTHYAVAASLRPDDAGRANRRRVAGYVGVIDERLDLELLDDLAESLPDWEIRVVGPVVKIDPATLPQRANITYPGHARYEDLPAVMARFDVALMPFALNEATRSISPTKTLEYLAAGLPVISTRVPDVVKDYRDVVELQEDGVGFARACVRVAQQCPDARAAKVAPLLRLQHWDTIASRMEEIISVPRSGTNRGVTA